MNDLRYYRGKMSVRTSSKPDDFSCPTNLPSSRGVLQKNSQNGAMHADELAARLEIDSSELMTELTELEIFGIVRSLPGKMYELIR